MTAPSGWKNALTEVTLTIVPSPCAHHRGDGGARRAQRREEVELERGLEVGVADGEEAVEAQLHAAHVVDQHVEAAVLLDGVADQPGRTLGVGEVDGEGRDAIEPLEGRDGARAGDDVRSLGGELAGHGHTDALARAGDDRDLARQFQVHGRTLQVDGGHPGLVVALAGHGRQLGLDARRGPRR